MEYCKLLKITLKKVLDYTKVDKLEPYTVEVKKKVEYKYSNYYSRSQEKTIKRVYLTAYPELISDSKDIDSFKEHVNKYLNAEKLVYSVDSPDK